jgi:eukaryotic-like serine/threonine-protein kinase
LALSPGTRLGVYEVTAQIGVGGMGEVYRATDTNLKRQVAIKVLPKAVAEDAERLARFQREAELLASLNHPNIAIIHGLEKSDGVTGLVMELVEGPTLSDRIAEGPISIDEAVPIAKQIAEALEAAHEQGIIHRDLKPANVKVREDGTVKVLDFGLAKAIEPTGAMSSSHSLAPTITTPAMTQMGMILGTAAYMAPEQARGKPVDKRSDIWAFGCVLWEMLVGERLFKGDDITETIASVVKDEPAWDRAPARVRPILRACLERDSRKRLRDIGDVWRLLADESPASSASGPRSRAWIGWIAAAVFAIAGVVAWPLRPSPATVAMTRFSFELPQEQQFTNTGRPVVDVSPDGTRIVYIANRRLYLRSMNETTPKEIPGSEESDGITTPAFSPDGQWIAYVSGTDRALKRISVAGGAALTIGPVLRSLGVDWSASGIVFGQASDQKVLRVSPSGGKPQVVFTPKQGEAVWRARMLPDGDTMLVTIGDTPALGDNPDPSPDLLVNTRVVMVSVTSGEQTTLIERGADARYLPTGHLVYADGPALLAVRFDLKRRQVIGDPVPVLEGLRRGAVTSTAQFSVADNGTLVYLPASSSGGQSLAFVDRQGRSELIKVGSAPYAFPRVSPDGKQIAVEVDDANASNIFIYDVSGANSIRQLTRGGRNRFPAWSSDGERVAFSSDRGGDVGIWWQRADGNGGAARLTQPDQGTVHEPLSWHPHEPTLLFVVRKAVSGSPDRSGGGSSLWAYSLTEKKARPLGVESLTSISAQFSPDGRWLAFHAVEDTSSRRSSIFVKPYPSTDATVYPVSTGSHPLWSLPDGSELFFARAATLYVTRVTTTPTFATGDASAVPAFMGSTGYWRNFDITPDGKIVAAAVPGSPSDVAGSRIEVVLNWFEELNRLVPTK